MFDPSNPDNLTPERKLFNVKVRLNEIDRHFHDLERDPSTTIEIVRVIHMMRVALDEIRREIDRTV